MNLTDKKIFQDLYKSSEGLMAFTFYKRYFLTPSQVYKFVDKYSKLEYIILSDLKIQLTDKGRQFILGKGLNKEEVDVFRNMPKQFINYSKIGINEFYTPIKDKLDPKRFSSLFEETEG